MHDVPEFMGFHYKSASDTLPTSNPDNDYRSLETVIADEEIDEDGGDERDLPPTRFADNPDFQKIIEDSCEELDIEVVFDDDEVNDTTNAESTTTIEVQTAAVTDDLAAAAEEADRRNSKAIQEALRQLLPETTKHESTMAAFKRLTNKSPWIPFRSPDSTSIATDVDNEEARLFDLMETSYKRSTREKQAFLE